MMAAASPGSRPDYLSFWFEADDASLQPGDVLQLSVDGQMHKAVQGIGSAAAFAGVYAPGPKPKRSGRVRIPIAIAGVVPVRASGTHAVHGTPREIEVGTQLGTSSKRAGFAVPDGYAFVGFALAGVPAGDEATIPVLLWHLL